MNVDDITVLDPIYSTVHELNEKTFYVKTVLHLFLKYNTIQYNTIRRAIKHNKNFANIYKQLCNTFKQLLHTYTKCTQL